MADYTEHYQLHQWQPQDPFLRTDFNEDLQKIDNTLRQLADTAATQGEELNQRGNCTIVSGNILVPGLPEKAAVVVFPLQKGRCL